MRKIYTILVLTLFLLGAGQGTNIDSVPKEKRVVRTNEQTTAIGEAKIKANKAETKEAETYKQIDSASISDGLR